MYLHYIDDSLLEEQKLNEHNTSEKNTLGTKELAYCKIIKTPT